MWRYRCWHRAFSSTHFCPRMSPMWITRWEKRSNTRLSWASRLRSLWLTTSHPVWSRWRSYDPVCWRPLLTPAVCGWKTRSVWMFSIDSVLIHSGPQFFVFASSLQKHTRTEETWKSWLYPASSVFFIRVTLKKVSSLCEFSGVWTGWGHEDHWQNPYLKHWSYQYFCFLCFST